MVGFGRFHYEYETGHSGDWFMVKFAVDYLHENYETYPS